jgi:hypothetical protein
MQSYTKNLIAQRFDALRYDHNILVHRQPHIDGDQIYDNWLVGGPCGLATEWDSSNVYSIELHRVWFAYRRLLWSGSDGDRDELLKQLAQGSLSRTHRRDWRDDFVAQSVSKVQAFGQWAANARKILLSLNMLATGVAGDSQDNWHKCSRCAGLYWGSGDTVCPAGGSHERLGTKDYVLYLNTPTTQTPADAQGGLRWCRKCSGLYIFGNPHHCPAGGEHDSTGSGDYFLHRTAPQNGIDHEGNWRLCTKCGVLRDSANGGKCPADGTYHNSIDRMPDYHIGVLGPWPPP